ncbi:hypothetical protein Vafri_8513, partial [Volvox africanus]
GGGSASGAAVPAPAAAAAAAAGAINSHSASGEGRSLGAGGGVSLKGTLAYNLVRQLERGDQEGDRRAGTVTLKQRSTASRSMMVRMQSQSVARMQSYARKPAPQAAPTASSGELQSTTTGATITAINSADVRRVSISSGAAGS